MRIEPSLLRLCLAVWVFVSIHPLRAAVPSTTALEQFPQFQAIAQHLTEGGPTEAERTAIRSWLQSEDQSLQALGSWLVGHIPGVDLELERELTMQSSRYGSMATGFAKVALALRATRGKPAPEREAAIDALIKDPNPFVAFEALRALGEINRAQSIARARELHQVLHHPLRSEIREFLRARGEKLPLEPIPGTVYGALIQLTSRFQ